jgi:hypothetical protein
MSWIREKFDRWNDTTEWCAKCGIRTEEKTTSTHDYYLVCEYEVFCPNCKAVTNYWAYGSFQEPPTKIDKLRIALSKWGLKWTTKT